MKIAFLFLSVFFSFSVSASVITCKESFDNTTTTYTFEHQGAIFMYAKIEFSSYPYGPIEFVNPNFSFTCHQEIPNYSCEYTTMLATDDNSFQISIPEDVINNPRTGFFPIEVTTFFRDTHAVRCVSK